MVTDVGLGGEDEVVGWDDNVGLGVATLSDETSPLDRQAAAAVVAGNTGRYET